MLSVSKRALSTGICRRHSGKSSLFLLSSGRVPWASSTRLLGRHASQMSAETPTATIEKESKAEATTLFCDVPKKKSRKGSSCSWGGDVIARGEKAGFGCRERLSQALTDWQVAPLRHHGHVTNTRSLLHGELRRYKWANQYPPPALSVRLMNNHIHQQAVATFSTETRPSDRGLSQPPVFATNKTPEMRASRSRKLLGQTKVPTPPSDSPHVASEATTIDPTSDARGIIQKGVDFATDAGKTVGVFLVKLPGNIYFYLTRPDEIRASWNHLKKVAKDEIHHYWVGFKLLWADIRTARGLIGRTLEGSPLTRRERQQLLRTTTDMFRLIPFSMFIIIPFMEFALPFALKLFPNLLPSTFQDSLKSEENMKRELQSRIAMAQFFQETLEQLAKEQKRKAAIRKKELEESGKVEDDEHSDFSAIHKREDSAKSMLEFLEKARNGEMMPASVIIRYANYFHDDLTLDNMPRMQLVNLCKYMSIAPYGSDAFLRFQLRHRIRLLKEDDQKILWEGIDSLTKMELREACQARGMRSTGLSKDAYKRALQQWLDLSVNMNVPISLLIMSRTFFLQEDVFKSREEDDSSLSGLADAISGLDSQVLNEAILEAANSGETVSDTDLNKIKLEVVSHQNELIRQEQAERDAKKGASESKEGQQPSMQAEAETSAPSGHEAVAQAADGELAAAADKPLAADAVEEPVADAVKEEDRDLSTDEMEVISQLVSEDPVSKERADLASLKAAMQSADEAAELATPVAQGTTEEAAGDEQPMTSEEADRLTASTIAKADEQAAVEAEAATKVTIELSRSPTGDETADVKGDDKEEDDPVIQSLKKRIISMVDKIEVQLSEAQDKIGDKLHLLDQDGDGVLSIEEVATAIQHVLKREITREEAKEIAAKMDTNNDGFFTVEDLTKWINANRLVKFVQEGRDAEMDKIMENQSSESQVEQGADKAKVAKEA